LRGNGGGKRGGGKRGVFLGVPSAHVIEEKGGGSSGLVKKKGGGGGGEKGELLPYTSLKP